MVPRGACPTPQIVVDMCIESLAVIHFGLLTSMCLADDDRVRAVSSSLVCCWLCAVRCPFLPQLFAPVVVPTLSSRCGGGAKILAENAHGPTCSFPSPLPAPTPWVRLSVAQAVGIAGVELGGQRLVWSHGGMGALQATLGAIRAHYTHSVASGASQQVGCTLSPGSACVGRACVSFVWAVVSWERLCRARGRGVCPAATCRAGWGGGWGWCRDRPRSHTHARWHTLPLQRAC
jgi:hypothetical protein